MNLPGWALLLGGWTGAVAASTAPVGPPAAGAGRTTLVCEAVYQPARSVWVRTVEIGYDQRRVRSVRVDGVPVYSFAIQGTVILTALDNERIRVDTASQTWNSDYRGLASAQGACERVD